jgi:hypothetical protein
MSINAHLAAEHAAYAQHERLNEAASARLARLATHVEPSAKGGSLVERVAAAFRPEPESCPTC